jgi:sugar transferase (PEP-CTERM system associated)
MSARPESFKQATAAKVPIRRSDLAGEGRRPDERYISVLDDVHAVPPRAEELRSPETPLEPLGAVPERITSLRFFAGNFHRVAALAIAETGLVMLAFYAAVIARFPVDYSGAGAGLFGPFWVHALAFSALVLVCLVSMGLYQLRQRARFTGVLARLVVAIVATEVVLAALISLSPTVFVDGPVLAVAGVFSFAALAWARYAFAKIVDEDVFKRRVLVWGAGERAATIVNRLRRRTDQRGFKIEGYVNAPGDRTAVPASQLVRGEKDLLRYVLRNRIEEIVIAMDDRRRGFPEAFLRECRLRGITVCDILTFLERETGRVSIELAAPSWLIYSKGFRRDLLGLAVKRAFDVVAAFAVIVLSAPLWIAAAIAIYLEDRGPILYRQLRTGQNGRPFTILKFRSMRLDAEAGGQPVWAGRNDSRVTRVGALIRKMRIDEIPQALNVLLGEMSFVGPRPERPEFVEKLTQSIPHYPERHFVKPGITGWAQVRYPYGASEHDAREKLGYDLYYVANHSLVFDIMVILHTVEIVLFRVGAR